MPIGPGVYVFKDETGKPIYVGKAKSLRARVRSYFQESRSADDKRDLMLDAAHDLETILVDNEHEAMALENNLIKQYQAPLQHPAARRQDRTLISSSPPTNAFRAFM